MLEFLQRIIVQQILNQESHKIGVLLLNMGGPTDIHGVEDFLKNIFNDPLIMPIKSAFVRKMVSQIIASKRLETAKNNYRAIGGGSPLIRHTFNLTKKLNALDSSRLYSYAMRYTPPFANDVLNDLRAQGVNDLILFSMYPQYSSATIYSSLNDIYENLKKLDYAPRVRVVEHFYDYEPFYELVVDEIEATLQGANPKDFILILSTHGLPKSVVDKGDPYPEHCQKGQEIIQKICKQRGLDFDAIKLSYQSKVGPMKWITPSTSDCIAESKHKNIIIYPLAFSIDNSETDYELRIEYKILADKLQIKDYRVCKCLNDADEFANMIINIVNDKFQPKE